MATVLEKHFPWILSNPSLLDSIPELNSGLDITIDQEIILNGYRARLLFWWILKKLVQLQNPPEDDRQTVIFEQQIQYATECCLTYTRTHSASAMSELWKSSCQHEGLSAVRSMPTTFSLALHFIDTPANETSITGFISTTDVLNVPKITMIELHDFMQLLMDNPFNPTVVQLAYDAVQHHHPKVWAEDITVGGEVYALLFILIKALAKNAKNELLIRTIILAIERIGPSLLGVIMDDRGYNRETSLYLLMTVLYKNRKNEPLLRAVAFVSEHIAPYLWGISMATPDIQGETPLQLLMLVLSDNCENQSFCRAVACLVEKIEASLWGITIRTHNAQGATPLYHLMRTLKHNPTNEWIIRIAVRVIEQIKDFSLWGIQLQGPGLEGMTPFDHFLSALLLNPVDERLIQCVSRVFTGLADELFWGTILKPDPKEGYTPLHQLTTILTLNPMNELLCRTVLSVAEYTPFLAWGNSLHQGELEGATPLHIMMYGLTLNPTNKALICAARLLSEKVPSSFWGTVIKHTADTPLHNLMITLTQNPTDEELLNTVDWVARKIDGEVCRNIQELTPVDRPNLFETSFNGLMGAVIKHPENKSLLNILSIIAKHAKPSDWAKFFLEKKDKSKMCLDFLIIMFFAEQNGLQEHPFHSCIRLLPPSENQDFVKVLMTSNLMMLWSYALKKLDDGAHPKRTHDFIELIAQYTSASQWLEVVEVTTASRVDKERIKHRGVRIANVQPLIEVLLHALESNVLIRDKAFPLIRALGCSIDAENVVEVWADMPLNGEPSPLQKLFRLALTHPNHEQLYQLMSRFNADFYKKDVVQKQIHRLQIDRISGDSKVGAFLLKKLVCQPQKASPVDRKPPATRAEPVKGKTTETSVSAACAADTSLWDLVVTCASMGSERPSCYRMIKTEGFGDAWALRRDYENANVKNTWTPWLLLVDTLNQNEGDHGLYDFVYHLIQQNLIPDKAWQQPLMFNDKPIESALRLLMLYLEKLSDRKKVHAMMNCLIQKVAEKHWVQLFPNHLGPYHVLINVLFRVEGLYSGLDQGARNRIQQMANSKAIRSEMTKEEHLLLQAKLKLDGHSKPFTRSLTLLPPPSEDEHRVAAASRTIFA